MLKLSELLSVMYRAVTVFLGDDNFQFDWSTQLQWVTSWISSGFYATSENILHEKWPARFSWNFKSRIYRGSSFRECYYSWSDVTWDPESRLHSLH